MTDPKPPKPKTAKDGTARGRPTKYKKEFIDKAVEYLQKFEAFDEDVDNYKGEIIPTIEGFARYIGIHSKVTLYNWAEAQAKSQPNPDDLEGEDIPGNPDFLNALCSIKNLQAILLQNGGLKGALNATITKLMLSANHDMREKSDVTSDDSKIGNAADLIAAIEAKRDS